MLLRSYLARNWQKHIHTFSISLTKKCERRLSTRTQNVPSESQNGGDTAISRTRNIGIIAHIDAGKTTTTERMLYYSGHTRRIGNVDEGTTVTDFLPAERARGVTIQSAAISFYWPPLPDQQKGRSKLLEPFQASHEINLIDTPGHADFTFEVLRSLRILDGAICILDGVAGVEAQTEKVWSQAANYHIPKLIYINKLDRDGASFENTVREIASRLCVWPAVCQIPWWEGGKGRFTGLGDAVSLRAYRWNEGGDGKAFKLIEIQDLLAADLRFGEEIKKARVALVELLSEHDDDLVEKFLEYEEDHLAIPASYIAASLRKCVIQQTPNIVPVLAGASFRNIGVQPLLDAIVAFLPSPEETPDPEISLPGLDGTLSSLFTGEMTEALTKPTSQRKNHPRQSQKFNTAMAKNLEACALVFKVVNDPRRGVLVYFRVYLGNLRKNTVVFNTNLHISERAQRILKMYASESVEVPEISAGQIGVIPGLKHARTGDTLVAYSGAISRIGPPAPLNALQLRPIDIPPAMFFAGIESQSLGEEKHVADALALLTREDPSLQVSVDEDSGQKLLSGMGEFHLEIAGDRLINDLKAKASVGKIEIAYRESILAASAPQTYIFNHETGGETGKAGCKVTVAPLPEALDLDEPSDEYSFSTHDGNTIITSIQKSKSSLDKSLKSELPPDLAQTIHTALRNGALAALSRGIKNFFPMYNTLVTLVIDPKSHLFGAGSTPAALSSAARYATRAALQNSVDSAGAGLLELVMHVTISVDEASLGAVVHDISSVRGGHIISLDEAGTGDNRIGTQIPLSKVYVPPDPFTSTPIAMSEHSQATGTMSGSLSRQRNIVARVPLKEMVGYLKRLRKLTGGRGTFVMNADCFERVVGQREKAILMELRGF